MKWDIDDFTLRTLVTLVWKWSHQCYIFKSGNTSATQGSDVIQVQNEVIFLENSISIQVFDPIVDFTLACFYTRRPPTTCSPVATLKLQLRRNCFIETLVTLNWCHTSFFFVLFCLIPNSLSRTRENDKLINCGLIVLTDTRVSTNTIRSPAAVLFISLIYNTSTNFGTNAVGPKLSTRFS